MISGGHVTIYVSDVDRAVRFYVETLGFKVVERSGPPNAPAGWAMVDAGGGLRIGMHQASPNGPAPGTAGATTIGLELNQPLDEVVEVLKNRGVTFRPGGEGGRVKLAFFADPDGNLLYLLERRPAS